MRILHTRLRGQVNKKSHLFKQIYFESMKCITESETERTNFSLNLDEYETMFRQPKLNFLMTHCKEKKNRNHGLDYSCYSQSFERLFSSQL